MGKTLTVRILTPEVCLFEGEADSVFLPGAVSPFEVLPGHAAFISSLERGDVRACCSGEETFCVKVSSGVVRVLGDKVTVCAEI